MIGDNPFIIEQNIEEDFLSYKKQIEAIHNDILEYENEYYNIRNEQLKVQKTEIESYLNLLSDVISKYDKADDFYNEEKTNGFFFKTASLFSKTKKAVINDQLQVNSIFSELLTKTENFNDFQTISSASSISDIELNIIGYKGVIENTENNFQNNIETEFGVLNFLQSGADEFATDKLHLIQNQLSDIISKIQEDSWSTFELNYQSHKYLIESIENLISAKETYFGNDNDLFTLEFKWFQFYNVLTTNEKLIVIQLLEKENWRKTFLIFYLNTLLVNFANVDLPTNDNDHVELGKSLSELEREQIRYIREYWFSKQIDATRSFDVNNPNIAVENLYNKRASTKHKRLSLREIVKLDMDLFTTFFPIILTTPDVASNLFKGQNKYFDIVMFDEASQLKLEDNLPALLKGKQIIIAGDEHQMPPSNYFSKIFDGTIEDEDDFEDEIERIKSEASNSLLDCESLLDFASELGFEKDI